MKQHADKLKTGATVKFRPHGQSMRGKVKSGALVTVEPTTIELVDVDDIVLAKVNGRYYLHLVKAKQDGRVLIGNNIGGTNGWTTQVFGKCTAVED
jgi:hypothetical protein